MARSKASKKKFQRNVLIFGTLTLVLGMGIWATIVYGIPYLQGLTEPVDVPPTDYEFLVIDYITQEEVDDDDHNIYIYRANIENLNSEEIADLEFSDYVLDETKDTGEKYEPELDEYKYVIKLNGSDFDTIWDLEPQLGLNTYEIMNSTESYAMAAYSEDELSVVVNQTNYDEWIIMTQTLDADGDPTALEGFKPYADFETETNIWFVIRIEFNTTADLSWCAFESNYTNNEKASGNYLYYEINHIINNDDEFKIDMSSDLGTDFEAIGIAIGTGNAGAFTLKDSQN